MSYRSHCDVLLDYYVTENCKHMTSKENSVRSCPALALVTVADLVRSIGPPTLVPSLQTALKLIPDALSFNLYIFNL